jgi:hypothetical protein
MAFYLSMIFLSLSITKALFGIFDIFKKYEYTKFLKANILTQHVVLFKEEY